MSAVPPELLKISLSLVKNLPLIAGQTAHLLIKMFGSQLVKCYSRQFTLQGFHYLLLTENDNSRYFSSSTPLRKLYNILEKKSTNTL